MKHSSPALWFLCALLAAAALPARAGHDDAGYIEVIGEARANLQPDMAVVALTVTREADTARAALDTNSEAMGRVLAAMRKAGIEERDLRTANFSIQPRYVYPQPRSENPPRIAGYTVSNSLSVRVRELDKLGQLIDTAVSLGVNQGGQVTFDNADPSAELQAARSRAVKDALSRAVVIAEAAGVRLGDIQSISENFEQAPPPQPMMLGARMAEADSVPIAAGENTRRVRVSLRVAIEQ